MLVAGIVFAQLAISQNEVSRIDLADRVTRLDAAWISHRDPKSREAAVNEVSSAVMSFFSGRFRDACRSLDRSTAALEGRTPSGLDALIVRTNPRIIAPGDTVTLSLGFAYAAPDVSVSVLGNQYSIGTKSDVSVTTQAMNRDGVQLITLSGLGSKRVIPIQVVRQFQERVAKLRESTKTLAIANALDQAAEGKYETQIPVADWLARGERILASGWESVEEIPVIQDKGALFRVQIPRGASNDAPVVIALHGAGGSENMFFESYGAGMAPKEAKKRGWVFISPRASERAVPACLAWLRDVRGMRPRRVFVMGHSMGGFIALNGPTLRSKPDAIALFAPVASKSLPSTIGSIPIFLSVGKQEMAMLRSSALSLGKELSNRSGSMFKEYDRCEHLMIVAEATKDAFKFFDRQLP